MNQRDCGIYCGSIINILVKRVALWDAVYNVGHILANVEGFPFLQKICIQCVLSSSSMPITNTTVLFYCLHYVIGYESQKLKFGCTD